MSTANGLLQLNDSRSGHLKLLCKTLMLVCAVVTLVYQIAAYHQPRPQALVNFDVDLDSNVQLSVERDPVLEIGLASKNEPPSGDSAMIQNDRSAVDDPNKSRINQMDEYGDAVDSLDRLNRALDALIRKYEKEEITDSKTNQPDHDLKDEQWQLENVKGSPDEWSDNENRDPLQRDSEDVTEGKGSDYIFIGESEPCRQVRPRKKGPPRRKRRFNPRIRRVPSDAQRSVIENWFES